MNGTRLFYFGDDGKTVVPATGYRVIRKMEGNYGPVKYPMGITRRDCDPTYSVVDIQTGYRYATEARTIHDAVKFALTVDLSKQPCLTKPAWKQPFIIADAYRAAKMEV